MIETTTAHTPGPWEFDDSGEHYARGTVRHNGILVAQIIGPRVGTNIERDGNALLVTAAPALLAELERVAVRLDVYAEWCERQSITESLAGHGMPLLGQVRDGARQDAGYARAAIAQATVQAAQA